MQTNILTKSFYKHIQLEIIISTHFLAIKEADSRSLTISPEILICMLMWVLNWSKVQHWPMHWVFWQVIVEQCMEK